MTHPKGVEPLFQEPESCVISTTLRVPNDTVISVPKTDTNIKLKMIIVKERGRANEIWSTIIPTTKTSPKTGNDSNVTTIDSDVAL